VDVEVLLEAFFRNESFFALSTLEGRRGGLG
jgi:hypothetical protein